MDIPSWPPSTVLLPSGLRSTATRPSAVHRHVHRPVTGEHAGELDVIGDGRLGLDFSAALTAP